MAGQDISKRLLPGQSQPVQVGGDFIFLKFADRPVTVLINGGESAGSRVVMEAGDKYRPGNFKSFEIENTDPERPAQILLTVGRGDYNRQIVKGEITVAPGIKTADGTWKNDERQDISALIVPQYPAKPADYSEGDQVATYTRASISIDGQTATYDKNLAIWREGDSLNQLLQFYGPGSKTWIVLRTLNEDLQLISERLIERLNSVSINYVDTAYYHNGRVYYVYWKNVTGEKAAIQIRDPDAGITQHGQLITLKELEIDHVWSATKHPEGVALGLDYRETGGEAIRIIDPDSLETVRSIQKTAIAESGAWAALATWYGYDEISETWSVCFIESTRHAIYNKDFSQKIRETRFFYEGETTVTASDVHNGRALRVGNWLYGSFRADYQTAGATTKKWALYDAPAEFQATAYAPACFTPLMRRDIPGNATSAEIEYTEAAGLTEIRGQIIRAALELYFGRKLEPGFNYLDHVYAIKIKGQNGQVQQLGKQTNGITFAMAGIEDDFTATFPAELTLTIDDKLKTISKLG